MGFEKYEKRSSGRGSAGPRISLRRSESIGVNAAAMEKFWDGADAAVLYYDEEANRLGIEPAESGADHAYTLQRSGEGQGASVNASSFMQEYGLVPERTTQYRARWDEGEELVVADLEDPVLVYGEASSDDEASEEASTHE